MATAGERPGQILPQFRALVIGRANAGKTTILRRIAQSADGNVDSSSGRGEHDIENELIFDSNTGFVFHDSPGIEAGSENEMKTIQDFISERAKATAFKDQLHCIWYCISTDNNRLLTAAEQVFFDGIDPHGVPVILVFTKFESQEADAFQTLEAQLSFDEALSQAPKLARQNFEREHRSRFMSRQYPPTGIVYLKNMDEEDSECSELVEQTMKVLGDDTLKRLFGNIQQAHPEARSSC